MRLGRLVLLGVLTTIILGAMAGPADAHTIAGPKPSNYRSSIVSVEPPVPGVSVRIVDLGSRIELTNRTDKEVTVLGYVGEPYLRIGPNGVYENLRSAATYLNRGRKGGVVPTDIDTRRTAEPDWEKVSDANSARWHDHRIHWMGDQPPPQVAQDPGKTQKLFEQDIQFVHDGQTSTIAVALEWVAAPSGLVWIPVVVALFALGFLAAFRPGWSRVLAVIIGALVVIDAVHAISYEIPRPGSNTSKLFEFLGGSFVAIVIWIAAVPTIIGVLRRKSEALYGVVFIGVMVALIGGATDLSSLWKSQLPNAGPALITRLEVAVLLGLGAGIAIGALARMLRSARVDRPDRDDDGGGGRWLSLLVVGLSDSELARIAHDLDAGEVLEVASRELAVRLSADGDALAGGAFVLAVDAAQHHLWSFTYGATGAVSAVRGRVEPVALELTAPFPIVLQLLAGTIEPTDQRIAVDGDVALLERIAPYLPERDVTRVQDGSTSAS